VACLLAWAQDQKEQADEGETGKGDDFDPTSPQSQGRESGGPREEGRRVGVFSRGVCEMHRVDMEDRSRTKKQYPTVLCTLSLSSWKFVLAAAGAGAKHDSSNVVLLIDRPWLFWAENGAVECYRMGVGLCGQ